MIAKARSQDLMIVTVRPSFPLSGVLDCMWHYSGAVAAEGREIVLPDGRFQVVIDLVAGRGSFCGLRSRHVGIDPSPISMSVGAVFRPGGAAGFLCGSALEYLDRTLPLDLVWGAEAGWLIERLQIAPSAPDRLQILEAALVRRFVTAAEERINTGGAIDYALRLFDHAPHLKNVGEVSREIGWSRRWLSHVFSEKVGITPKRYCRLVRFQKLLRQLASGGRADWADVALAGGFSDQAHLIHEFRAFSGLTPEFYIRAERPFPNHVRTHC